VTMPSTYYFIYVSALHTDVTEFNSWRFKDERPKTGNRTNTQRSYGRTAH